MKSSRRLSANFLKWFRKEALWLVHLLPWGAMFTEDGAEGLVSTPVTSCNMKNIKSNIKLCKFKENQTPCNVWWRWSQPWRCAGGSSFRLSTSTRLFEILQIKQPALPHLTPERTSAPTHGGSISEMVQRRRRKRGRPTSHDTRGATMWRYTVLQQPQQQQPECLLPSIHAVTTEADWSAAFIYLDWKLCISMFKHILYFDKSTILKITHMWPKRAKSAQTNLDT